MIGLLLTAGRHPVFDPALIRLQEKLRPPLAEPNLETLLPDEVPAFGVYLFGTDDLGRDVFARMLQGAWVSLTVGFVAVGISVLLGIFMGGIAGYYGQHQVRLDHILAIGLVFLGAAFLAMDNILFGFMFLFLGVCCALYCLSRRKTSVRRAPFNREHLLGTNVFSIDTLIMRIVDIMLCFPSFFDSYGCGAPSGKHLQYYDRHWIDQLDGHHPFCTSRVSLSEGTGFRHGGQSFGRR